MGMLTRRTGTAAVALTLALGAAACSDDGNQVTAPSFDTTPAPLTAAPTTETASTTTEVPATSSTAAPGTTSTTVTTVASTAVDGPTGPMFSDALGVKVDTAPGVTTRGDTRQLLPEGLYVHLAWEADPNDPSVFTPQPEDVEILEAYANAVLTYYRAATTTLTTDDPDFDRYYADGGAKYDKSFQEARDGGYTLSLGSGVVLRPYVLSDERSDDSAIVFDCYLEDQSYFLQGSLPPLGELATSPTVASMVFADGVWRVDRLATDEHACL